ncbi:DUF4139 domain-containing protein [bacterium]|nr:DUF4139 domain-containing protein [bacterium]
MFSLNAPIVRVTLLEDRALVRRQVELEIPQGVSRWKLAGLSPVLVDKTLTAQLTGPARVLHLTLDRRQPAPPPLPPPAPDEEDIERQRLRKELGERQTLLDREIASVATLQQELLQDISQQVAWGCSESEAWEAQIRELADWKEQLVGQRHQLVVESESLMLPPRPFVPAEPPPPMATEVVLEIEAPQAQTARLQLEYSLPCACWRPSHRAVLGPAGLEFTSEACCWQNTGEDWNEVELVFSTQRPSLGSDPPKVAVDTLRAQKKSQEVVVAERDLEIHELAPTSIAAAAPSTEIPGIDDRGQSVHLKAEQPATIPSNGKPIRVPLFSFQCEAEVENLLMAEVCSEVVQRSRHHNTSAFAVLAGPVDLIRESGLIGRVSLLYVAAGEAFALGWGPQASLRATRSSRQGNEEKDDLLGGWVKSAQVVELTLSNLSADNHTVRVVERVPVSELKQVEVVHDAKLTSQGATPDANGFVTWNVDLPPRGRHHLKLAYALRRRKEVVTA